jgi:hypothetical protein
MYKANIEHEEEESFTNVLFHSISFVVRFPSLVENMGRSKEKGARRNAYTPRGKVH